MTCFIFLSSGSQNRIAKFYSHKCRILPKPRFTTKLMLRKSYSYPKYEPFGQVILFGTPRRNTLAEV